MEKKQIEFEKKKKKHEIVCCVFLRLKMSISKKQQEQQQPLLFLCKYTHFRAHDLYVSYSPCFVSYPAFT